MLWFQEAWKSKGGNGNYHSALMLVFLLGSAAVALAFVPVLISSSNDPTRIWTNVRNITQPLHAAWSVAISILCLYFTIKKKTWKSTGRVQFMEKEANRASISNRELHVTSDDQSQDNSVVTRYQKVSSLHVIIFGVGAEIWLLCDTVRDFIVYCTPSHSADTCYGEIITSIDQGLYILSIVVQVTFLIQYDGAILPNTSLFHYSIALMIADKVWVWLNVTLSKIRDVSSNEFNLLSMYDIGNFSGNISFLKQSSDTTLYTCFEVMTTSAEPFFVEFLTLSIGVLLHLWNSIGKWRNRHELLECFENINGCSEHAQIKTHDGYRYRIESDKERLLARKRWYCRRRSWYFAGTSSEQIFFEQGWYHHGDVCHFCCLYSCRTFVGWADFGSRRTSS